MRVVVDEMARGRLHRAPRAIGLRRAGQHRPRLGDEVDPALRVRLRAERSAVVEVCAPIPLAVPAVRVQRAAQLLPAPAASA